MEELIYGIDGSRNGNGYGYGMDRSRIDTAT